MNQCFGAIDIWTQWWCWMKIFPLRYFADLTDRQTDKAIPFEPQAKLKTPHQKHWPGYAGQSADLNLQQTYFLSNSQNRCCNQWSLWKGMLPIYFFKIVWYNIQLFKKPPKWDQGINLRARHLKHCIYKPKLSAQLSPTGGNWQNMFCFFVVWVN